MKCYVSTHFMYGSIEIKNIDSTETWNNLRFCNEKSFDKTLGFIYNHVLFGFFCFLVYHEVGYYDIA